MRELSVALVKHADDLVRKEFQGRGATTLVMLLATASGHLVCANVGDSRAYSWEPDSRRLDQVTIDDTIENELRGLPGNPDALIKARGLQGRLSQAVGEGGRTADELRVQTFTKERFRFGAVLGTDGLWRAAKDFESAVANAPTPLDAVRRAIALANWVGGVDNASLIAVGDVERFCGCREAQPLAFGRWQTQVSLWVSSTKIKILTSDWIGETKTAETRAKPEKKNRSAKKKRRETVSEPQLALDAASPKEVKPKIEVTVEEEPKKSE